MTICFESAENERHIQFWLPKRIMYGSLLIFVLASCRPVPNSPAEGDTMGDLSVPVVSISEAERNHYLEVGYNAPTGEYDREALRAECQSASDRVKAALQQHWKHIVWGSKIKCDGDFLMNDDFGPSRFLCVEISREEVLTAKLLQVVHAAVLEMEPNYSVDICDAFSVLKTNDGMLYPRFNIFVEKKRILVYSESEELLERLQ